jgi:hypothetical protein
VLETESALSQATIPTTTPFRPHATIIVLSKIKEMPPEFNLKPENHVLLTKKV